MTINKKNISLKYYVCCVLEKPKRDLEHVVKIRPRKQDEIIKCFISKTIQVMDERHLQIL